ncbi:MAG: hypothetical protein M2R45_05195 [Verrucomicrobia subdivision 3 bacterium]|nr:hypothetical protein [Limisphaerales bacterium]
MPAGFGVGRFIAALDFLRRQCWSTVMPNGASTAQFTQGFVRRAEAFLWDSKPFEKRKVDS